MQWKQPACTASSFWSWRGDKRRVVHAMTTTCNHCNFRGSCWVDKQSPRVVHAVTATYTSLCKLRSSWHVRPANHCKHSHWLFLSCAQMRNFFFWLQWRQMEEATGCTCDENYLHSQQLLWQLLRRQTEPTDNLLAPQVLLYVYFAFFSCLSFAWQRRPRVVHAMATTCIHCNLGGSCRADKQSPQVVHSVTVTYYPGQKQKTATWIMHKSEHCSYHEVGMVARPAATSRIVAPKQNQAWFFDIPW